MTFKSFCYLPLIFLLFACSGGGKKYLESESDGNKGGDSCGYATGYDAGLDYKNMDKECRKNPSKEFLRGYKRAMSYRLGVNNDNVECKQNLNCDVYDLCVDNKCLWGNQSCQHDFECKITGVCKTPTCFYKK